MKSVMPSTTRNPQSNMLREPYIILSNSDGSFRVLLSDIAYCSSYNSSTTFHLNVKKKIVTGNSIGHYEKLFVPYGFLRIHQSILLNAAYFCHCCKGDKMNMVELTTGEQVNMARAKKKDILQSLQTNSIEGKPHLPNSGKTRPNKRKSIPDSQKPKRNKAK
jgi:DNA-binding LytR/AlgR family response regulator